jgi:hypothetical protein
MVPSQASCQLNVQQLLNLSLISKPAKTFGLTIPAGVLAIADGVIE